MNFLKGIVVLYVSLFSAISLLSQNRTVDSLKNLLSTSKNDTNKVMLLNLLGWQYLNINLEQAANYENEAAALSKDLNYKTGLGISLTHLGYIATFSGKYNEALEKFTNSLTIFKETGDKERTASSYTNVANIYYYTSDYQKNIEYNKLSLDICNQLNDSLGIANTYTSLGNAYLKLGNYPYALRYFMDALNIYEKKNDRKRLSGSYNNIAIVYKRQKDISNAMKYYNLALKLAMEFGNKKSMGECYNNIGVLYMEAGKNNEAMEFFNKTLELFKEIEYNIGIATVNGNIGEIYQNMKDYTNALQYFNSSAELKKSIGDIEGYASSLQNLSETYIVLGNLGKAKDYTYKSLEFSKQINSLYLINSAYKLLGRIYSKENNFGQAYHYLELFQETSDSLFDIEKTKEVENIKTSYEVDKKENEIKTLKQDTEILKQKNKIQQLQISRNKFIVFGVSGIFILLILLAILFINRQRIKNKKDQQIHETKKALIEAELKNITLEKDRLNTELEYRKKEVAGLATQIIEKNNLIEEIEENIKKLKENNKQELDVLNKITLDLNLNKTREDFYVQVEELHKDFFFNLSEKFPDLTRNEKKLAALLRMELTSKDIATIMNISAKSVDMNRYRLRKKLNIDNEINLTDYLKTV